MMRDGTTTRLDYRLKAGKNVLSSLPNHKDIIMLTLTRRVGEKIIIGNHEIVVEVREIRGHQVRLGITAPSSIAVNREEIFERKKKQEAGEL